MTFFITVCDANYHVNNLKGSTSQTVSGWTFDAVEKGPWSYTDLEGYSLNTSYDLTYMLCLIILSFYVRT